MFNEKAFADKYGAEKVSLTICGRNFKFFLPRNIEKFIDLENPMNDFPLWPKVWPSSMILADYVASRPVENGKKILEIGAGIGIAGVAAAAFGHDVVISECNEDALEFARANAIINGQENVPVVSIDWNNPKSIGSFEQIIGSEVVFRNEDFAPLQNFFKTFLKPGGNVILTSEIRGATIEFFRQMSGLYNLSAQQKSLSSEEEKIKVIICKMTDQGKQEISDGAGGRSGG
jgi:predicted nicotinamide N-methyase